MRYQPEFISEAEEEALVSEIGRLDLPRFVFQRWESLRRSRSFGYAYDFQTARFGPSEPIPDALLPLRRRAAAFAGLVAAERLVQVSVIRYDPGAGIGWHIDRPELDAVIGVSLGAAATMRFRRKAGPAYRRAAKLLPPRSIYHLAGEVRYDWEHSVPSGRETRWSITFRGLSEKGSARLERLSGPA